MKSGDAFVFIFALILAGMSASVEASFTAQAMALIKIRENFPASPATFSTWVTADPCDGTWVGVMCDKKGLLVVSLDLNGNGLNGSLSPAIGQLTGLLKLLLYNNHLSGPIPAELGQLTMVQTVWLFNNELTGEIPPQLGNMSSCTELALYNNRLTGPVPGSLAGVLDLRVTPGNRLCSIIPGEGCPTLTPTPAIPFPSPGIVSGGPVYPFSSPPIFSAISPPMPPPLFISSLGPVPAPSPASSPALAPAPFHTPSRCPMCVDGLTAGPDESACGCVTPSPFVLRFTRLTFANYTSAEERVVVGGLAALLQIRPAQLRVVTRSAGSVILKINVLPLQVGGTHYRQSLAVDSGGQWGAVGGYPVIVGDKGGFFTADQVQNMTGVLQNSTSTGLPPQYTYTIICKPLAPAAPNLAVPAAFVPSPPAPPATPPSSSSAKGSEAAYIGALIGGGGLAILLLGILGWCCWQRKGGGEEVVVAGKGVGEKTWVRAPVKKQLVYTSVWSNNPQTPLHPLPEGAITDSGFKRLEEGDGEGEGGGGGGGGGDGGGDQSSDVSDPLPKRVLQFDFKDYNSDKDSPGKPKEGGAGGGAGAGAEFVDVSLEETAGAGEGAGAAAVLEVFPFKALQAATKHFSKEAILGEGRFGIIYKAELAGSRMTAVVQLSGGKMETGEFLRHVSSLGEPPTAGVVQPIGYCAERGQRIVVYPFLANCSLKDHLHGELRFGRMLTWHKRIRIAADVADCLSLMHDSCPPTVHTDVRGSTILLDADFRAKVSQYARSALGPEVPTAPNLVSRPYQAPELRAGEGETPKGDVFAFGVVLLELFTGRKALDMSRPKGQQSLLSWVLPQLDSRRALASMVDPYLRLNSALDSRTLHQFVMLAGRCLQYDPESRPSMAAIADEVRHLMANDASTDASRSQPLGRREAGNWGGDFAQSNSDDSTEADSVMSRSVADSESTGVGYNGKRQAHSPSAPAPAPAPYLPRTPTAAAAAAAQQGGVQMSPPTLPSRPPSPGGGGYLSGPRPLKVARSSPTSPVLRPRHVAARGSPVGGSPAVTPRGEEGVQTAMDMWAEIRKTRELPLGMEGWEEIRKSAQLVAPPKPVEESQWSQSTIEDQK